MEILTKIEDLEGKTIKKASQVDFGESVALIFTDNSCAFFGAISYGDSHDIELIADPKDYLKRDAGIISETEYELMQQEKHDAEQENIRKRELNQLATLKKKYEP